MNEEEFTSKLMTKIDTEFERIMQTKPEDPKEKFLNYADAQALSSHVKEVFNNKMGSVPNQINGVLNLCESVLSPTNEEKITKITKALELLDNYGKLVITISTIATALGLGATASGIVTGFAITAPAAGPVGIGITAAVVAAAIAAYLVFSGNDNVKNTEKYMNALKDGLKSVMPEVWKEFCEKLSD